MTAQDPTVPESADPHGGAIDDILNDASHEVVVVLDERYRVVSASEFGATPREVFGIRFDDVVGHSILDVVHPDDRIYVAERLGQVSCGVSTGGTELRVGPVGGPYRYVFGLGRVRHDAQGNKTVVALLRDIDDRKSVELQLAHLALHDSLTDLPNRVLFLDRLEQAMVRRARVPSGVAVLVVNLDRFKYINDGLGTPAGDEVLVHAGRRLRAACRLDDTLARLGGDEFGIMCEGFSDEAELLGYAHRLRDCIREPLALADGTRVSLDCSIGIAFSEPGAADTRPLLLEADAAKNVVKQRGRGGVELSTGGLTELASTRVQLEQELREAIAHGNLCVYYQPQVDRLRDVVIGVEALVRWNHPERGLVSPAAFVPVAEESDLIVDIGNYVLWEACSQMANWHRHGMELQLSVNLAARHLVAPGFLQALRRILATTALAPAALTLEVTESTLFQDTDSITAIIDDVRAMGVHLSLDDFGTGYSSLVYLRRFEVGTLKIDQSFVQGIGRHNGDEMIIRGIVNLARSMQIEVVAEGVETDEQARWLAEIGCDVIQGYLYSRPQPAEALHRWLITRAAPVSCAMGDPAADAASTPSVVAGGPS